jgi:glycosyltransferase involved in cell wall biosynthesis
MKCLWISRDLPFPLDAGDKVYSANMSRAVCEAGVQVRFFGFGAPLSGMAGEWPVEACAVGGRKHGMLRGLLSRLPLAAAIHDTTAYRQILDKQLEQQWDVIVLDSYGSGWALDACVKAQRTASGKRPVLVYLSHNHEENLWHSMARDSRGTPLKKAMLWLNYRKVRALERRILENVDLVTAITEEDAQNYSGQAGKKSIIVLTPGYSGRMAPEREIDIKAPCRVVLVGSFRWVVKQENLRRFLEIADKRFMQQGVRLDVIGDVPPALLNELRPLTKATEFHGFVDDVSPFFNAARMAVVPEFIGGGFKLKYLDYIFGRVPVASISAAAVGLPDAIRRNILCRDDLKQLVDAIIEYAGEPGRLNRMQQQAFIEARTLFQWKDRGEQFRLALNQLRNFRADPVAGAHP